MAGLKKALCVHPLFLIFWLGGWYMGFTSAIENLLSNEGLNLFLIFWLGGWTVGGLFAVTIIYRIFRKTFPETLLLHKPNLLYDSGIPPFQINFQPKNQKEYWKSMFVKRKNVDFTNNEIKSLKLRETDSGNRLTIDLDTKRFEFAQGASEIEREWLFNYLTKIYF